MSCNQRLTLGALARESIKHSSYYIIQKEREIQRMVHVFDPFIFFFDDFSVELPALFFLLPNIDKLNLCLNLVLVSGDGTGKTVVIGSDCCSLLSMVGDCNSEVEGRRDDGADETIEDFFDRFDLFERTDFDDEFCEVEVGTRSVS